MLTKSYLNIFVETKGFLSSAFRPRRDVVGVHLLYLKMPSAGGADALLPLIHLAPRVAVECANAEAMRT